GPDVLKSYCIPAALCVWLSFAPTISFQEPLAQEFALQFWDNPKHTNTSYVVAIIGMLLGSKGESEQEVVSFARFLVELLLASNMPTPLKTAPNPLLSVIITPYMPVPETNLLPALDVLVEPALRGEYNGLYDDKKSKNLRRLGRRRPLYLSTHMACISFVHLIRSSPDNCTRHRSIPIAAALPVASGGGGGVLLSISRFKQAGRTV
ncbi:hypothetical protein CYLTODRAFT_415904, partial [Cylindrobasidium torrendii FP15055 ss-10]